MKNIFIIIGSLFVTVISLAQTNSDALFSERTPLNLALNVSLRKVSSTKGDTTYIAHKLYYRNGSGKDDSIHIGLKRKMQRVLCSKETKN